MFTLSELKITPNLTPDRSKWPQDRPNMSQDRPKITQDGPKTIPKLMGSFVWFETVAKSAPTSPKTPPKIGARWPQMAPTSAKIAPTHLNLTPGWVRIGSQLRGLGLNMPPK